MKELVFIRDGKSVCSSLDIANKFGKNHFHVMRDIETKILNVANKDFTASNFGLSEYIDESGKSNKMYLMTRDGFSILAMGFTGKKAMEWKIKFITAFNQMERLLLEKQTPQWEQTRQQGKLIRSQEVSAIKKLVEYAKEQGSTHADRLYMVYSKLANKTAGIQNRENATISQLNNLTLAENIIGNVIETDIKLNKDYKDIYSDCKHRLESFKAIAYLAS